MVIIRQLSQYVNFINNKHCQVWVLTRNYFQCKHNLCAFPKQNKPLSLNIQLENSNRVLSGTYSRSLSISKVDYAKNKDKGKDKKKPKMHNIDLREANELIDIDDISLQMTKAIERMKNEFVKNLTLRSTTGSIEQITVSFDGKDYQLQELAQISRKPKVIVLNVISLPQAIPQILESIRKSGLNINPQQDGTTIFLPIPKVTKEHRENLAKNAKVIFIKHRDEIKDVRNKALKTLKKKSEMSTDTQRRISMQLDALCDKTVKEAEKILDVKQNELLQTTI